MDDYVKKVDIEGELYGVNFSKRNEQNEDNHVMIELYSKGVKLWFKDGDFSSHWIDDLIEVLQKTKGKLEQEFEAEEDGYGYKYKE